MWKEVFASLVILSILGPTECIQISNLNTLMKGTLMQINKPSKTPGKTKPEIDIQNVAPKPGGGIPAKISPKAPTTKDMETALKTATAKVKNDELTEQKMPNFDTPNSQTEGFGPHLLTSPEAIKISESARVMIETAKNAMKKLNIEKSQRVSVLERVSNSFLNTIQTQAGCEFTAGLCNQASQYRTPDGSCNNVANPLWGKSHTPFERFIPAFYEDGLDDPRATDVFGDPLPLARDISVNVHTVSDSTTQMNDLSHFSMEFGQFVSHDIQMNALSKGQYMSNLNCCRSPNTRNCFPIPLPSNDPFYGSFNRTCMNFVRALETTKLDCSLGERQQLNMNTHFLDGSAVYGSNKVTANSLRQLSGGRLESTNNQLLPKDIPNASSCRLPPGNPNIKCFKAGDPRFNQQPALMALQTIWMKEHNRIADRLTQLNHGWNDERAYQEARKIIGAMIQHVTYNEYLPHILGNQQMIDFELKPRASGYFTGYDQATKPQIRNGFSAAAFRFGHSMVRQRLAYNGPSHSNQSPLLRNEFLRPNKLYDANGGVSSITRGLYEEFSQKVDRKITKELTERLFERTHGFGGDLAAINVQRGRDHGLASYNVWRMVCDLTPADDFTAGVSGGLEHHSTVEALALKNIYSSPWDIDLFTGGVSETPIPGGKVGPTFACMIGLQFRALKFGDRFFYESNTDVKFTPAQLTEIKKATMARIICENTNINSIPSDVFRKTSASNSEKSCSSLPEVNLQKWQNCVNGGWSSYVTINRCTKRRRCNRPAPNGCGKRCLGSPIKFTCGSILKRNQEI
ncbi:salivary peroxidase/catechol oxidase-like [Mytilus galloprovincialis]|uniref:salivary peroxidase/catechol oxidase-like n=1 Tax=Mytilus galloprovincialis TaxID=29158 RepID=UPI003F7BDD11